MRASLQNYPENGAFEGVSLVKSRTHVLNMAKLSTPPSSGFLPLETLYGHERHAKTADEWRRLADLRLKRFFLQSAARELLPEERVAECLRAEAPRKKGENRPPELAIQYRGPTAECPPKTRYSGLIVCDSVWTCPVCAARITGHRRADLHQALKHSVESGKNYTLIMLTFTLQHTLGDRLADLLKYLGGALDKVFSGSPVQRLFAKFGIVGRITALESTWGWVNGWHPHKHMLLFSRLPLAELDLVKLRDGITQRYTGILEKQDRYASYYHAVDVRVGNDAATDYVSKWGLDAELTRAPVKEGDDLKGLSPFQLLEKYANGPVGQRWAGELFQEYARAMKGRHQLQWSKGLRELLGMGEERDEDQDQDPVWATLATLTHEQWLQVESNDVRGELLEIALSGNPEMVAAFLRTLPCCRESERRELKRRLRTVPEGGGQERAAACKSVFTGSPRAWG